MLFLTEMTYGKQEGPAAQRGPDTSPDPVQRFTVNAPAEGLVWGAARVLSAVGAEPSAHSS